MQQYYNKISEQKRIAFIDNLTDGQAKNISEQYPFAICFANADTDPENGKFPVIWLNGQRYGFTGINQNSIPIGDSHIRLYIDENGILGLTAENANFSIYPSSNQTITTSYLDVRATIPNNDYSKLIWELTRNYSSTNGTRSFKFNNSDGNTISGVQSVRVIPNYTNKPEANKGSINLVINQGTQSTTKGEIKLVSTFTQGSTNGYSYSTDLKATYESLTPKQITITYQNSTPGLMVGTWSWNNIPNLPEGITYEINNIGNTSTITFTNNTTSDYTINAGIIEVSNNNATNVRNNNQFTIPGKIQQTVYYWYVGETNPSSVETLVSGTNTTGWHEIGTSTSGFNLTFNNQNMIEFENKTQYYLIIPNNLHAYAADGNTLAEGAVLNPVTCNIANHKAFQYYTSVYEVKGLIIK